LRSTKQKQRERKRVTIEPVSNNVDRGATLSVGPFSNSPQVKRQKRGTLPKKKKGKLVVIVMLTISFTRLQYTTA